MATVYATSSGSEQSEHSLFLGFLDLALQKIEIGSTYFCFISIFCPKFLPNTREFISLAWKGILWVFLFNVQSLCLESIRATYEAEEVSAARIDLLNQLFHAHKCIEGIYLRANITLVLKESS